MSLQDDLITRKLREHTLAEVGSESLRCRYLPVGRGPSGPKHVDGSDDVLAADGTLVHPLSALGAGDHVSALQQDTVDGGVHADLTEVLLLTHAATGSICRGPGPKCQRQKHRSIRFMSLQTCALNNTDISTSIDSLHVLCITNVLCKGNKTSHHLVQGSLT